MQYMREHIEGVMAPAGVMRYAAGRFTPEQNFVCREETWNIKLNDAPLVSLICTGAHLRELGAGFVVSEGLARRIHAVHLEADRTIHVQADVQDAACGSTRESSGGPSLGLPVAPVASPLLISVPEIFSIIGAIESELWRATGGAHCSVLFSGGGLIAKSSDIGRHNSLDKVIGHAVLNGLDLAACIIGCTGRQPAGMVAKAARAGIPIIVSKAATTREGADLARAAGITLICRVKNDNFAVYSHAERITGCPPAE